MHVRFCPKADKRANVSVCPLCANSGLMHRSKERLFDQLVGAAGQRQRDGDAKRLGGLEVDEQLQLRGLLHRQIGGLLAFEDAVGVDADLAKLVRIVGPIAHQAAGRGELAIRTDRGNRVPERQCAELSAPAEEK